MGRNHLLTYNPVKNSFDIYSDSSMQGNGYITQIKEDKMGNLWMVKLGIPSLLFFDTGSKRIYHIDSVITPDQKTFPTYRISSIFIDSRNILWIGTTLKQILWCGLNRFEKNKPLKVQAHEFNYFKNTDLERLYN